MASSCHWSSHLSHQVGLESSDGTAAHLTVNAAPQFLAPRFFHETLLGARIVRDSWTLGTTGGHLTVWPPELFGHATYSLKRPPWRTEVYK